MELLFHYMYINYHMDLAVLPLDQRVQQANSRTSASSCWCGRRRGGRDPRCWPAASSTTSQCWTQPRGPAGSDAPSCVQGARFRVARGLLDPRLALLRGRTRQQSTTGGYHRCAVGVRERSAQKVGFPAALTSTQAKKKWCCLILIEWVEMEVNVRHSWCDLLSRVVPPFCVVSLVTSLLW